MKHKDRMKQLEPKRTKKNKAAKKEVKRVLRQHVDDEIAELSGAVSDLHERILRLEQANG